MRPYRIVQALAILALAGCAGGGTEASTPDYTIGHVTTAVVRDDAQALELSVTVEVYDGAQVAAGAPVAFAADYGDLSSSGGATGPDGRRTIRWLLPRPAPDASLHTLKGCAGTGCAPTVTLASATP